MDLRSGKQTGEESSESLSEQETTMEPAPITGRGRKSAIQTMLEDMMKTIQEDRKRQEEDRKRQEEDRKRQEEDRKRQEEDRRRLEETIKQGRKEDLQKLEEGRKEDLQKLEEGRKEDLKRFEQGRKEDMETMVKVIEQKVQAIKEEIRRETQTWKQDLKEDMEKTEQEIAMVANKTMEIEETMKKQEDEMRTIGRNVAENTHNIEHVKRQVEDRVNGNRNEMELERKRTKEQIEELQKEVDRVRELKGREGNINNLHPMVFIKSINQRIKEIEEGRIDEETKLERIKEIMRENLESEALIWFNGIENDVEDYEQLRNRFLQHFWGDNAQLMYQPSRGEEDVQPRRQVNFQRRRSPSRSEERAEMPINEDADIKELSDLYSSTEFAGFFYKLSNNNVLY
ncbi:golgin subfamily A member 6-like protein 6 [Anoplophora glabripennis]|uniref:golgin subfamily A member 6-like protein 6 n=1 Tax=Anoplophora glabripennis TaxID=217634 RepID=UPI000C76D3B6|nr:golgin subfamily A member 6-like protein 6 [Anoplophora glabripennis]